MSGVFSAAGGGGAGKPAAVAPASASRSALGGGRTSVPSTAVTAAASCDLRTPLPARKRQRKVGSGPTPVLEHGGVLSAAAVEVAAAPSPAAGGAAGAAAAAAAAAARRSSAAAAAARPVAPSSELDALEAALDSKVPPLGRAGIEGVLSPPPRLTARMRAALLRRNSFHAGSGSGLAAASVPPRVRAFSHPSFAATAASNGVVAFGELAAAGKLAREEREAERQAASLPSRPKRGARK